MACLPSRPRVSFGCNSSTARFWSAIQSFGRKRASFVRSLRRSCPFSSAARRDLRRRRTWNDLALGNPPYGRPLYVGKSEDSLLTRDRFATVEIEPVDGLTFKRESDAATSGPRSVVNRDYLGSPAAAGECPSSCAGRPLLAWPFHPANRNLTRWTRISLVPSSTSAGVGGASCAALPRRGAPR
jgi:hypothetical protein